MSYQPPNRHSDSTQTSRGPRDSFHTDALPCELPSPIWIPEDAFWTCLRCKKHNKFDETSRGRPLGRMHCANCTRPAHFNTKIHGVELIQLQRSHYKISLPPDTVGLPMTQFGIVCCRCGRSHLRTPQPAARIRTPSPPPAPLPEKPTVVKRLKEVAKKITKTVPEQKKEEEKELSIEHTTLHIGRPAERRAFNVRLDKRCTCDHKPCDLCLKFRVEGPVSHMEWIARATDVTDGVSYPAYRSPQQRVRDMEHR